MNTSRSWTRPAVGRPPEARRDDARARRVPRDQRTHRGGRIPRRPGQAAGGRSPSRTRSRGRSGTAAALEDPDVGRITTRRIDDGLDDVDLAVSGVQQRQRVLHPRLRREEPRRASTRRRRQSGRSAADPRPREVNDDGIYARVAAASGLGRAGQLEAEEIAGVVKRVGTLLEEEHLEKPIADALDLVPKDAGGAKGVCRIGTLILANACLLQQRLREIPKLQAGARRAEGDRRRRRRRSRRQRTPRGQRTARAVARDARVRLRRPALPPPSSGRRRATARSTRTTCRPSRSPGSPSRATSPTGRISTRCAASGSWTERAAPGPY